jgi:hypothetical protein
MKQDAGVSGAILAGDHGDEEITLRLTTRLAY